MDMATAVNTRLAQIDRIPNRESERWQRDDVNRSGYCAFIGRLRAKDTRSHTFFNKGIISSMDDVLNFRNLKLRDT
jgi:hypothetical protein